MNASKYLQSIQFMWSFGVKNAPNEFSHTLKQILSELESTDYYFDDIIVHGKDD